MRCMPMSQAPFRRGEVVEGRAFCPRQARTVTFDTCLECRHVLAANERGPSPFIVCTTASRGDDESGGRPILKWWLKASRRPDPLTT